MFEATLLYLRHRYGEYLFKKGRYETAFRVLLKLAEKYPQQALVWHDVAVPLLRMRRYEEAIPYLEKAIAIDDKDLALRELLWSVYQEAGDFAAANRELDNLIELEPANHVHYLRKALAFGKEDFAGQIEFLENANTLFPDNADLYSQLGYIYSHMGQAELSKQAYETALRLDPYNTTALNNYGYALSKEGKYAEALPYFEKCFEADPEFAYPYDNAGLCYLHLGNHEDAIDYINHSLGMDPENSYAYKNRAKYYLEINDTAAAKQDLEKALTLGYRQQYGNEVDEILNELNKQ